MNINKHRERIWKMISSEIVNLSRPVYSNFIIKLDNTDEENTNEFKWTFQHLEKGHTNIFISYGLIKLHANKLNNELLNSFKEYLQIRIKSEGKQDYASRLIDIISGIIESLLQNWIHELDDINFKYKRHIYISPNRYIEISLNEYQFLLKLIKDKDFINKINEIQRKNRLLNDAFDNFKSGLKGIHNMYELKGKCEMCSFWNKW